MATLLSLCVLLGFVNTWHPAAPQNPQHQNAFDPNFPVWRPQASRRQDPCTLKPFSTFLPVLSSLAYTLTHCSGTHLWHLFIFLFRGHLFLGALWRDRDGDCVVSILGKCSPPFPGEVKQGYTSRTKLKAKRQPRAFTETVPRPSRACWHHLEQKSNPSLTVFLLWQPLEASRANIKELVFGALGAFP